MSNFLILKVATWLRCLDSGLLPRSSEILTGPIQVSLQVAKERFYRFYSTYS